MGHHPFSVDKRINMCYNAYTIRSGNAFDINDGEMPSTRVGVDCGEGPPVPIPNTEVKLICADDTWRATARENR